MKARANSWNSALALAAASSPELKELVHATFEDAAAVLARLVVGVLPVPAPVLAALRSLEQVRPWWTYVTVPELGRPPAGPIAPEALAVPSIDALIARLDEIVARCDQQRSRLSVYPTIYRRFCHRVKDAVTRGGVFENPDWLLQLDLHFATQYLKALEAFEAGRMQDMPRCWALTLEATAGHDTITYQDLVLAVNVRLNHDLRTRFRERGRIGWSPRLDDPRAGSGVTVRQSCCRMSRRRLRATRAD